MIFSSPNLYTEVASPQERQGSKKRWGCCGDLLAPWGFCPWSVDYESLELAFADLKGLVFPWLRDRGQLLKWFRNFTGPFAHANRSASSPNSRKWSGDHRNDCNVSRPSGKKRSKNIANLMVAHEKELKDRHRQAMKGTGRQDETCTIGDALSLQ
jgi:hypothetical protein